MPNPLEQFWDTEGDEVGVIKRDFEFREGVVTGEQLAKESDRGANSYEMETPIKPSIYFSPYGFVCNCGNIMASESIDPINKTVKTFCTNFLCSENLVTKIVQLPCISYKLVLSSGASA